MNHHIFDLELITIFLAIKSGDIFYTVKKCCTLFTKEVVVCFHTEIVEFVTKEVDGTHR